MCCCDTRDGPFESRPIPLQALENERLQGRRTCDDRTLQGELQQLERQLFEESSEDEDGGAAGSSSGLMTALFAKVRFLE